MKTKYRESNTEGRIFLTQNFPKPVGLIVAGILLMIFAPGCRRAKLEPNIEFESLQQSLGKLPPNENAHTQFRFQNTGKSTLAISSVRTSCSCIEARVSKRNLAPGNTETISIKYIHGPRVGPLEYFIFVKTNVPDQPSVKLTILGEVKDATR